MLNGKDGKTHSTPASQRSLAGCVLALLLAGAPEAALAAARCSAALGADCHGNTGWFPDHDKLARVRVGGNWETRICAHGGVANPCHKNKGVTGVTTACPKGPTEPEILCRRFDAGATGSDYPVPFATLAELQAAFNSKAALGQACIEGTYRHDASGNCKAVTDGLMAQSCTAAQVDVCDGVAARAAATPPCEMWGVWLPRPELVCKFWYRPGRPGNAPGTWRRGSTGRFTDGVELLQVSKCIRPRDAGIPAETRVTWSEDVAKDCPIHGISWTSCLAWNDWYPDASQVCKNSRLTQVKSCRQPHARSRMPTSQWRTIYGAMDCYEPRRSPCRPRYGIGSWAPAPSTVCLGHTFLQRFAIPCSVQGGCKGGKRCPAPVVYRQGATTWGKGTMWGCDFSGPYVYYNPEPPEWTCYEWGDWRPQPKAKAGDLCDGKLLEQFRTCTRGKWATSRRTEWRTLRGTKTCA